MHVNGLGIFNKCEKSLAYPHNPEIAGSIPVSATKMKNSHRTMAVFRFACGYIHNIRCRKYAVTVCLEKKKQPRKSDLGCFIKSNDHEN